MAELAAEVAGAWLVGLELFPDDGEVGFVSGQAQHDQVGVSAAQDVLSVWVVVRLSPLFPDIVHDLVLAFSGDVGVGQDDLDASPTRVVVETVVDVVLQTVGQSGHERGARRDAVAVKMTLLGLGRWQIQSLHKKMTVKYPTVKRPKAQNIRCQEFLMVLTVPFPPIPREFFPSFEPFPKPLWRL